MRLIRFSSAVVMKQVTPTIPPSNNAFCCYFRRETLTDRNYVLRTLQAHCVGAKRRKHLFSKKIQLKYLRYSRHKLATCIIFPFLPVCALYFREIEKLTI